VALSTSVWRSRTRPTLALTAGLLLGLAALPCRAQEDLPPAEEMPEAQQTQAVKPQGDTVSGRLLRLEEKVQDFQVSIGTLESFLRTKPGTTLPQEAPAPVAPTHEVDLGPRIDALETQIGALTSHLEQLTRQMSALEKLSAAPPAILPPPSAEPVPEQQGEALPPPSASSMASADASENGSDASEPPWHDAKPSNDAVADLLKKEDASDPAPMADDRPQNLAAALPTGDAQTLYQQGYGALLQKDYAGAEGAFRELVNAYPNDPLAGNAQYWIGETYYVRGQYKNAADAFLKGYKKYKSSEKAPDTLLKLGMALAELGQKDAACSTFNELKSKYPGAPEHIRDDANAQRKRAGC
jgi:tol-pal system protein YbgF